MEVKELEIPMDTTGENMQKARIFLENQLFKCFTTEDLLSFAIRTNIRIPGFTRMNYHKVPVIMLKNLIRKKLKTVKEPLKVIRILVEDLQDDFNDLPLDKFAVKVSLIESISKAEKLALFYLNYPIEYDKNSDQIDDNIVRKIDPLNGILYVPLSEKLQNLDDLFKDDFADYLQKVMPQHVNVEGCNSFLQGFAYSNLKEYLLSSTPPRPGQGYYLMLYDQFKDEIDNWEWKEKIGFKNLLLYDAIYFTHSLIEEIAELQMLNQEIKNDFSLEIRKIKKLHEKQMERHWESRKKLDIRMKETKEKLHNSSQVIKQKEKRITKLVDEMDTYQAEFEKERQKHKQMKREYEAFVLNAETRRTPHLFEDEKIYLFTTITDDTLTDFFGKEQIIHFEPKVDFLSEFPFLEDEAICFVNLDGLPVKQSFLIEREFENNDMRYRIVSGGSKNIVRKIIYYLEGVLRHEVKKTY